MKIFSDVAVTESLSKTAERLNLSRSYVTRSIAELEAWMQARLFQRTTRAVKLTHEGELFLHHCQHVMNYVSAMENEQQIKSHTLQGELTLTSSIAFTQHFLTPVLVKFNQMHPGMIVNVIATDEVLNLVNEKIDLALRVTNHPDENLVGKKMADFPLHAIA